VPNRAREQACVMNMVTPRDVKWAGAADDSDVSSSSSASPAVTTRQCEIAKGTALVRAAVATSCGTRHALNEDSHSALDGDAPLFVVADGVGGGAQASRASRELVSRLHASLAWADSDPRRVRDALLDADRAIERGIATESERSGAATVALCKATEPSMQRWLVAWVGDCRVYQVSAENEPRAQLLTVDDTYRELREAPPSGGSPDDPARMVGNGAVDAPNLRGVDLRSADMLVLCSDGVHKHASAPDIARLLCGPGPLAARCERLVALARSNGSHDDATVLVVQRTARGGK
jgi:serine/threonine protein phosphatase PrpC